MRVRPSRPVTVTGSPGPRRPSTANCVSRWAAKIAVPGAPASGVPSRWPGPKARAWPLPPRSTTKLRPATVRRATGSVSAQGQGLAGCPSASVRAKARSSSTCARAALAGIQAACAANPSPPRVRRAARALPSPDTGERLIARPRSAGRRAAAGQRPAGGPGGRGAGPGRAAPGSRPGLREVDARLAGMDRHDPGGLVVGGRFAAPVRAEHLGEVPARGRFSGRSAATRGVPGARRGVASMATRLVSRVVRPCSRASARMVASAASAPRRPVIRAVSVSPIRERAQTLEMPAPVPAAARGRVRVQVRPPTRPETVTVPWAIPSAASGSCAAKTSGSPRYRSGSAPGVTATPGTEKVAVRSVTAGDSSFRRARGSVRRPGRGRGSP